MSYRRSGWGSQMLCQLLSGCGMVPTTRGSHSTWETVQHKTNGCISKARPANTCVLSDVRWAIMLVEMLTYFTIAPYLTWLQGSRRLTVANTLRQDHDTPWLEC